MKNIQITLQPLSLLVGAGLLGIMLITTGAFTPQGTASARDVSATEIVGTFNPRTVVRIVEGSPYTVPAGKLLVLTAIFCPIYNSDRLNLNINGTPELTWSVSTPKTIPPGFVVNSGSIVEPYMSDPFYVGHCNGYLVDA